MLFHPYPNAFPADAVMYLSPILRGGVPEDRNTAINAAYCLIGFALNQVVPVKEFTTAAPLTSVEVAEMLEGLVTQPEKAGKALPPVPWDLVVRSLANLLVQWLGGK